MTLILEHKPQFTFGGFAHWWRSLDKPIFACMILLLCIGLITAFSTSPQLAARTGSVAPFRFAERQLILAALSLIVCLGLSMATPREIRRSGVLVFAGSLIVLVLVLMFGAALNGSQRWLSVFGFSIQPSEFVKPGLIAVTAWMFSLRPMPGAPPAALVAVLSLAATVLLVGLQPDYSQTALICAVWGLMFFLTGASIVWAVSAGIIALAGAAMAYAVSPYVAARLRILTDLNADAGGEQIGKALAAIREGGLLGVGPGEGVWKARLPDAHSDFAIAVVAEEFGLISVLLVIAAFAVISLRSFLIAGRLKDGFSRLAVCGLAGLIAFQAIIHIGVSARLLPPTGMTLPLISYGGSSLLAMGIVFGMLLGLTRADLERTRPGPAA